jgi:hypothetical protein
MGNLNSRVVESLSIGRRFAPIIVAATVDPLSASVVTNPDTKSLNVLKGRRGIRPTLVQQEDDLWRWLLKKITTRAWLK